MVRRNASSICASDRSCPESAMIAAPRPVIFCTADFMPTANSPWPITIALASSPLLIDLFEVFPDFGRGAHLLLEPLVEARRRIHSAVFQQVIQRDHLGDHGDVLARIEVDANLRNLDVENHGRFGVESGPLRLRFAIPFLELDDDLDALLLPNGANPEHGRDVPRSEEHTSELQ